MAVSGEAVAASAIVPTLGQSPWLEEGLRALRRSELEIVLVAQGAAGQAAAARVEELCDHVLLRADPIGFAAANNLGLEVARGDHVAMVNDDVLVEEDWYAALAAALDADPGLAAVQGVNLRIDDQEVADGCGLGWNRWLQAVQLGHRRPPPSSAAVPRPIFGVSATAALYRRSALESVADPRFGAGSPIFDDGLFAYYEDVDLACRLRHAGHGALLVPAARARHAGSASGRRLALGGWPLIYGNRHLVLGRHLGRDYWRRLPRVSARDVLDLARAVAVFDAGRAAGIMVGWSRALRLARRYLHLGPPAMSLESWIVGAP